MVGRDGTRGEAGRANVVSYGCTRCNVRNASATRNNQGTTPHQTLDISTSLNLETPPPLNLSGDGFLFLSEFAAGLQPTTGDIGIEDQCTVLWCRTGLSPQQLLYHPLSSTSPVVSRPRSTGQSSEVSYQRQTETDLLVDYPRVPSQIVVRRAEPSASFISYIVQGQFAEVG